MFWNTLNGKVLREASLVLNDESFQHAMLWCDDSFILTLADCCHALPMGESLELMFVDLTLGCPGVLHAVEKGDW